MPVEAKAVFQNEVFHPATVNPKLQAHLGLSLEKRIFDKYVGFIFEYVIYDILNIFCIFSWVGKGYKYFCPLLLPKSKAEATSERGAEGAMTGDDYDLMLHCTIGHLLRVDGALPDFDDGEKALNLRAPPGEPRYIFCIFINGFFVVCRYGLRRSKPVYGFWYYFIIHSAIGIHLQKILPRFVPKTDSEVDALLDCNLKLRVYVPYLIYFGYSNIEYVSG
jgi:hypothetical protein